MITSKTQFNNLAEIYREVGVSYIGGINTSSKLMKNQKVNGHYTYIIYLAPADTSGFNVCSHSTPECRIGCLATSGRAAIEIYSHGNRIQSSRIKKTLFYKENPELFLRTIAWEIANAYNKAIRDGFHFSVRLNGTSDIDYVNLRVYGLNIFEMFPRVTFYDYTKNYFKFNNLPSNYHLTYSYSGRNSAQCEDLLKRGINVAMVFNLNKKDKIPSSFAGYPVIDGDITDLRVDEAKGIIVGLHWKKIANKEHNDFVKSSIFAIQPDNKLINI